MVFHLFFISVSPYGVYALEEMDNFFSVIGDFRNKSAHGQRFYTIQTKNERGIRYKLVFNDISYNEKEISHVDTSVFALILTIKVVISFCFE